MTPPTQSSRDEALRLRHEGMSVAEIATALQKPRATVGDWVRGVERGPYLYAMDCSWCGDYFVTKDVRARFCCHEHAQASAGRARTERTSHRRIYPSPMAHGTIDAYFNHGCRCEACRKAGSEYMRDRRQRAAEYRPKGRDRV